jgi:hypothetical protein
VTSISVSPNSTPDERTIAFCPRHHEVMEMKVKKLLVIAAMAASLAAPAIAQSWDPDVGSGNIAPPPYGLRENGSSIYQGSYDGSSARAQTPRQYAPDLRMHVKKQRQQKQQ